jgi:hypothetical protein
MVKVLRLTVNRFGSDFIPPEDTVRMGGDMTTIKHGLLSLAAVVALTIPSGCEKPSDSNSETKAANSSQRSSAEGLAIVEFFVLKKLQECSARPGADCAFTYEGKALEDRPMTDHYKLLNETCQAEIMDAKPFKPTIIVPTKDRCEILSHLLESIRATSFIPNANLIRSSE